MDPQQALTLKAHLEILKSRLTSLQGELDAALREREITKKELEALEAKRKSLRDEFEQRRNEIEEEYNNEVLEYQKQNRLAEEVLENKREERKALLEYLYNSHICERTYLETNNFDWPTLERIAHDNDRKATIDDQIMQKATVLDSLNKKARARLNTLYELLTSTLVTKNRASNKLDEIKEYLKDWEEILAIQEKKIQKMQNDNERLNALIKQCASTNEPMSDYITKNVRAKCHSFLNSSCPEELLVGLSKFQARQARMIKLLKHKESKLSRETNHLQVAKDQTSDQMQYYLNIIQGGHYRVAIGERDS